MPKIIISIIVVGFQRMPTTENYEKMLGTWVGAPEERLISAWGPPNQTYVEAPISRGAISAG